MFPYDLDSLYSTAEGTQGTTLRILLLFPLFGLIIVTTEQVFETDDKFPIVTLQREVIFVRLLAVYITRNKTHTKRSMDSSV